LHYRPLSIKIYFFEGIVINLWWTVGRVFNWLTVRPNPASMRIAARKGGNANKKKQPIMDIF